MPFAQGVSSRHGYLPAVFGHRGSVARNLFVVAGSAFCGIIIGGVSVLSVVAAVSSPPSHDAPIGSMVFDGPHVVRTTSPVENTPADPPAVANAPVKAPALAPVSTEPAAALPAQPAAPFETQAMRPAQPQQALTKTSSPAQGPRPQQEAKGTSTQAWPKAPSTRNRQRPQADEDVAAAGRQNAQPLYDSANTFDYDRVQQYDNRNNFFGFGRDDSWRN